MTNPSRRSSTARRALSIGLPVVAALVVGVSAPAASAASTTPGDFSSKVSGNPNIGYVDNCTVELGPVFDSVPAPNYRKIGGVRVNCSSVRAVIKATVWEQYSTDGHTWFNWGYSNVGTRYNQTGSGYTISGILRSPPVCSPTRTRGFVWRTAALVQTERAGRYLYSTPKYDASGC